MCIVIDSPLVCECVLLLCPPLLSVAVLASECTMVGAVADGLTSTAQHTPPCLSCPPFGCNPFAQRRCPAIALAHRCCIAPLHHTYIHTQRTHIYARILTRIDHCWPLIASHHCTRTHHPAWLRAPTALRSAVIAPLPFGQTTAASGIGSSSAASASSGQQTPPPLFLLLLPLLPLLLRDGRVRVEAAVE